MVSLDQVPATWFLATSGSAAWCRPREAPRGQSSPFPARASCSRSGRRARRTAIVSRLDACVAARALPRRARRPRRRGRSAAVPLGDARHAVARSRLRSSSGELARSALMSGVTRVRLADRISPGPPAASRYPAARPCFPARSPWLHRRPSRAACRGRRASDDAPVEAVREILADVRERGDAAVRELTERFDGVRLDDLPSRRGPADAALDAVPVELRDALEVAAATASRTSTRSERRRTATYERDGIVRAHDPVPVDRAGCYVPGGRAVYPSTVLMTAVPARVAGVARGRVVRAARSRHGHGAARDARRGARSPEVDEVYRIGGAQAIAAMAYGTESDPRRRRHRRSRQPVRRDRQARGRRRGSSSACRRRSPVRPRSSSSPTRRRRARARGDRRDRAGRARAGRTGVADHLVRGRGRRDHGRDRRARRRRAARRSEIESTLAANGYAACSSTDPSRRWPSPTSIAPEHLELIVADPEALVPLVRHAGAVFCGPWAPASIGDYVAGPIHVLPTHRLGAVRRRSPSPTSRSRSTSSTLDDAAFERLGPARRRARGGRGSRRARRFDRRRRR